MGENGTAALQGKQHFEVLDGLRGVAALFVVYFHFCEFIWPKYPDSPVGHGFLAVDFFFCLSGFVISYAYDDRMPKISIKRFFTNRLIRLHPLVVIGVLLGVLAYFFDPFGGEPLKEGAGKVIIAIVLSLFLIPAPALPDRFDNLFGLNAPAWSLFWEYVANIVYALFLWRIRKNLLAVLVAISAVVLVYVSYRTTALNGGWGYTTFPDGLARVSFSFMAGLLVRKLDLRLNSRLGFISLSILLGAAFSFPFFPYDWLLEAIVVIFLFPLVVLLGAGTKVHGTIGSVCRFFGNISYPLYMTHYSTIWMFGFYFTEKNPGGWPLFWIIVTSMAGQILVAWLIMRFVDEPVRAWLTRRFRPAAKAGHRREAVSQ
ncbi:MAG: acyltransferase [Mucilaginibacter polytrichastri]|nr:acyltransferase [Mucilaginibacter polytrichastri]